MIRIYQEQQIKYICTCQLRLTDKVYGENGKLLKGGKI